ncbi:indole-3-glycerol phosphate synthase TrpC [Thermoactinomyces mirandus]|uniref:Indole-3-glycerol phosphate synthase n=1 Tax=Thermoactinomyces mirandus TaxID=2756294 RepID=A0A7W2AR29_9BACL|nr:indole-3-glycerol phosphate synthase TrpC [Thermoactinomyces mirandus]MBA4602554.1 indole-3-glycerol phosphate synthase TrpC [Thermoactinomyces mirandus]
MFLERIAETKRKEVAELVHKMTPEDWERACAFPKGLSLKDAILNRGSVSVIAEVKKASPSKGVIVGEVDPVKVAEGYERGGAAAISVLTDATYFHGSADFLVNVKQAIKLPVLRKDFIIDERQVLESKLMGADAILLIVALLNKEQLQQLTETAHRLGLEVLVEIHEKKEIPLALACEADVLGINNRNLHTFATDISNTERLRPLLPKDRPVIGESGVLSLEDARRMQQAGVQGILVGEYLMRQEDPMKAVRELCGGLSR